MCFSLFEKRNNSVFTTVEIFRSSEIMLTLRKKRKLEARAEEIQESPRNHQSQNSAAPGFTEDFIAQVSEDTEGRVTKIISQEVSRTESRILGALTKLDEVLLNPQIRTFSGSTPGSFRNTDLKNQKPRGDRSLNKPHHEVELSARLGSNLTDSEDTSHMVTWGQEEIPYCSPGTSSGKQTKARSTSQPEFRSEDPPATIEADQFLLALQRLASNSNSAHFSKIINKKPILPKSLTTTMPIYDGNSEKFVMSDDLFHTSLKTHNQLTEEDEKHCF